MLRAWLTGIALVLVVAASILLSNTSLLGPTRPGRPTLLAHRGLHQTFSAEGLKGDTCTAARIHPPEHSFLENTIASMRAAFDAGGLEQAP